MKRRHKWRQYKFLNRFEAISSHLPETQKLKKRSFHDLIEKYGDVIVKPDNGRRGRGVFRVCAMENDDYQVHTENKKKTIQGEGRVYEYLKKNIRSRKYIVQRRISLATVNDCPMDVRVIVQRTKTSEPWTVTANVVKVAGKGYIVTNIKRSKGTVLPVKTAIRKSSLKNYSWRSLLSDVEKLALRTANQLTELYPAHRIFAFDMGLDHSSRVWLIEVNRFPMMSHFRHFKDKTMYRRILRYKKG